jgi:lysophospholipase L1-like esterase
MRPRPSSDQEEVRRGSRLLVPGVALAVLLVLTSPLLIRHLAGAAAPLPPGRPESHQPVVLVLGDSYVLGSAMNRGPTWPDIAGARHGWQVFSDAVADTGYVAPGHSREPLAARADGLARNYDADVMIVAGGLEDVRAGYPQRQTIAAAGTTFRVLRSALPPHCRLVVLSPFAGARRPSTAVLSLSRALEPVARRYGATYIDVTGFLGGPGLVGSDGIHPTDAGQHVLARRIAQALVTHDVVAR